MPGFTRFDNPLLEAVLTSSFTKRQLKILLLIVRFSSGCQKSYAVLRKTDFAYAGVSPYCIATELQKLAQRKVIRWDHRKDLVWINPDLEVWAGDKSGDNLRRFFKIATKNLPKWQLGVYQNSNLKIAETARVSGGNSIKEKGKEKAKKVKEEAFLKFLTDYYLKVSPLSQEEAFILRELTGKYSPRIVEQALDLAAAGEDRSFAHFLKTLEGLAGNARPRRAGLRSLKSTLDRRMKAMAKT